MLLDSPLRSSSPVHAASNMLLYVPFGFFVAGAIGKKMPAAVAGATLAGFVLSFLVETFQFYDIGRVQELSDLWANTLGTFFGAVAAALALRYRVRSIYVAFLLVCWLGSRWYPALPPSASFPAVGSFRYFAQWLAIGLILEALFGTRRSRVALPLVLGGSLLVRLAIYLEPEEIMGGAAAALLWSGVLWRVKARAKIAAALFVVLAVVVALSPFHFSATPRPFGWVPFRGFFEAPTETAVRVFLEKAFLYGGMVWLLVRAGLSIGAAAVFGAVLELSLRVFQVYLPGRSAEITDALMVLALAGLLKLVRA